LGALAGQWLRSEYNAFRKILGLIAAGLVCLAVGYCWGVGDRWGVCERLGLIFPIIKNIWTSSFVLVAGGWSLLLLAFFYTVIDVLRLRHWAFFFVVIGSNAIVAYLAPTFIRFEYTSVALFGGAAARTPIWGPTIIAAGVIAVEWLLLLLLYRKRWFLRV